MDFISVIGLVGFISAIIFGLEGQWDIFWTGEGISIVIGGSFGAVMLRSTAGEFFNMFPTMLKIFRHKIDKPVDLIDQMVELATIARKMNDCFGESEVRIGFCKRVLGHLLMAMMQRLLDLPSREIR